MYAIIQIFMIIISHLKFCGYVPEVWETKCAQTYYNTTNRKTKEKTETKHYAAHEKRLWKTHMDETGSQLCTRVDFLNITSGKSLISTTREMVDSTCSICPAVADKKNHSKLRSILYTCSKSDNNSGIWVWGHGTSDLGCGTAL